ncbi:class I SAM-dependent methyltransferase [candidate division KSB1 bacterium]|nr:class I SAM-dependent methyltransferase [candidate division KSB1 bacterium]
MAHELIEEKKWWDNIAHSEENDIDDEYLNRRLRWREIERHLDGVNTILDIGAGTGAFSIPLAKKGYKVTHIDLSSKMIDYAKEKAKDIHDIEFIEASGHKLNFLNDKSFDLVLNLDGAISFSGNKANEVISETCRLASKKVILSVSNKACMIPTWIKYSLKASNKLLPAVHEMIKNGYWHKDQFPENEIIYKNTCNIISFKSFTIE